MVDNCSTTGQIVSPLLSTSTTTDIYLFMIFPKIILPATILSSSIRILIVTLLYMDFILKILKFGYLFFYHILNQQRIHYHYMTLHYAYNSEKHVRVAES